MPSPHRCRSAVFAVVCHEQSAIRSELQCDGRGASLRIWVVFPTPASRFPKLSTFAYANCRPKQMIVPADTSSGLRPPSPQSGEGAGALEMDIVSRDVKKFFGLLLKKNGYVLEQLYSPLIVGRPPRPRIES